MRVAQGLIRTDVREFRDRSFGVAGGSALTLNRRPEGHIPVLRTGKRALAVTIPNPQDERVLARFNAAVSVAGNGCHIWTRARNNRGYGVFWLVDRLQLAHRVSWLLSRGDWPAKTMRVDHICENKPCVNPEHLRELTNGENIMRSPLSPMNLLLAATDCRNGHPYDNTTRIDGNGWRVCSRCPSRRGRSS